MCFFVCEESIFLLPGVTRYMYLIPYIIYKWFKLLYFLRMMIDRWNQFMCWKNKWEGFRCPFWDSWSTLTYLHESFMGLIWVTWVKIPNWVLFLPFPSHVWQQKGSSWKSTKIHANVLFWLCNMKATTWQIYTLLQNRCTNPRKKKTRLEPENDGFPRGVSFLGVHFQVPC